MPTGMMLSVTMRDQTNEVSLKKMTEWGGRQWQPLEDGVSSLCWPSGRCSRSRATRARRRPGLAQALGPDGPGAARSRGPASPCLAVRLRGSRGQLSDTPGALSRVPGRGAGPSPEKAEAAPLVAAGWRATWLQPVHAVATGAQGSPRPFLQAARPPCAPGPALVPGLVSMVTGRAAWSSKVVAGLCFSLPVRP